MPITRLDELLFEKNHELIRIKESDFVSENEIEIAETELFKVHVKLSETPTSLSKLTKLYVLANEYGVLQQDDNLVFFGAAILSSTDEINAIAQGDTVLICFDLEMLKMMWIIRMSNGRFIQQHHLMVISKRSIELEVNVFILIKKLASQNKANGQHKISEYEIKDYIVIRRNHLSKQYYLKSTIQAEPLIWQWYAWAHLMSPATAACNIVERHIRIMKSYIQAPQFIV